MMRVERLKAAVCALAQPEYFFLLFGIPFGAAYALLNAPLFVADEPAHFYRAFHMAEGHLLPVKRGDTLSDAGAELPAGLSRLASAAGWSPAYLHPIGPEGVEAVWELRRSMLGMPLEPDKRAWAPMANAANFGPVCYVPAAFMLALLRCFEPSPLVLLYAGRLATLAAYLGIVFLALRAAPFFRWTLAAVALLPMSMLQAASLSADAMTNALALLVVAATLHAARPDAGRLAIRGVFFVLAPPVLLLFAKPAYFALAAMPVLVPRKQFGSWRRYIAIGIAYAGAIAFSMFAMFRMVAAVYVQRADTNRDAQLHHVLNQPGEFMRVVYRTLADKFSTHPTIVEMIAGHEQHNPFIQIPGAMAYACLACLVLASLCDSSPGPQLRLRQRFAGLVIFVALLIQVFLMLYLYWTPVGSAMVGGVHGRVLIPLLPVLLLVFSNRFRVPQALRWTAKAVPAGIAFAGLFAGLLMLLDAFYLPKQNLVSGGDFRANPERALAASEWILPVDTQRVVLTLSRSGNRTDGLLETWNLPDGPSPHLEQNVFGVKLSLQPDTHYTLHVECDNITGGNVYVSVSELDNTPGGLAYRSIMYFAKRSVSLRSGKRLQTLLGDFQTLSTGKVLVYALCPTARAPVKVCWRRWAVTEHETQVWRRWMPATCARRCGSE